MMKIKRPTLIIDESIARSNIRRMVKKCKDSGVVYRPHFKTHHSHEVGRWYREEGVKCITVSSVSMAHYFAMDDWDDITIAFPYNPLEIDEINALAAKIDLTILIESKAAFQHAHQHLTADVNFFIKIDVGTHRTGLEMHQIERIKSLATAESRKLHFKGILAHAGHTYRARSKEEILKTHEEAFEVMKKIKAELPECKISYGDTPSASVLDRFEGMDEVRPGNLVYYDLMQSQIGSCEEKDIAIALACPVVARHLDRNELVVYGGAVHLSKDQITFNGQTIFGMAVRFHEGKWEILEGVYMDRLSQEHGIVKGPKELLEKFHVGDVLGILPVHSCLLADMMTNQVTLEGKKVTKMEKI